MKKIIKFFEIIKPSLIELYALVLAFFTSLSLVSLTQRPLSNTYGIVGAFDGTGFNPDNNYVSMIFIILATVIFSIVFSKIYKSKFRWIIHIIVIIILVINYVSLTFLANGVPAYAGNGGIVDSFHGGEQLAPTRAFMNGQHLYSDIFFLRGAGVDVLFNAIGLSLLGQSVGSFLLLGDLFLVIGLVSFLVLLAYLVKNPILYTFLSVVFFCSTALSIVEFRDVIVWFFIGVLLAYFKPKGMRKSKIILLSIIGFVSTLSLYISIDRGVMLLGSSLLLCTLLTIFKKEKLVFQFSPKTWKTNIIEIFPLITGLVVGLLLPALFIGFDSFKAFIKMTFFEIPKFGGLLVSQPYPSMFSDTYLYWGPVFIAIAAAFLLYNLFRYKKKDFNILIPYAIILVFAIISLKIGSNRIALAKLATATTPLYLITVLVLIYAIVLMYTQRKSLKQLFIPTLAVLTTLLVFINLDTHRILEQPNYSTSKIYTYMENTKKPDNLLLQPDVVRVKDYVQSKTTKSDYIFSFTSNPIYYYAADRMASSRFFISWFTDPDKFSSELLNDLKENNPSVIIYSDKTWMDAPDGISMQTRIPMVNEWILTNYTKKTILGDVMILEKQ